jgi:hypothetical protein
LAGFGDRHPEQPLGVLSNHLLVCRLVPRVGADSQDFIEEGLLGAVERGVRRVCTRLRLLGELLRQLPADFAGLLVLKKFVPRPIGNDVVLLTGGLAVFSPGEKPFAHQLSMRGIQLLPYARDVLTIGEQKFVTQIMIALGVWLSAGSVPPRF